jgi:NADH dehydrogenase (ubiquinone) Fe-S protein 3
MNIKNLLFKVPVLHYYKNINNDNIILVPSSHLILVLNFLKYNVEYQYNLLSYISGVDYLSNNYRFSVVYDLLSITYNSRIRIKCLLYQSLIIESCINVFKNGDWWEREVWDFFGIYFFNNSDLRRILTDYGFEGHPMRRDFPLSGFFEFQYDSENKSILISSNEFSQEYRLFSNETYWGQS